MLALKQEFRASSKNLPFHIKPSAPKKGRQDNRMHTRVKDQRESIDLSLFWGRVVLHINKACICLKVQTQKETVSRVVGGEGVVTTES